MVAELQFVAIPISRNDFSVSSKSLIGGQCFKMPRLRKVFTLPNAESLPFQALVPGKHLISSGTLLWGHHKESTISQSQ